VDANTLAPNTIRTPYAISEVLAGIARGQAEESRRRSAYLAIRTLKQDLGPRHLKATLDNFEEYHALHRAFLERMRQLGANVVDHVAGGNGLLLAGPSGTGKDHVAVALLKVLAIAGLSCRWVNAQTFLASVAEAWHDDNGRPGDLEHALIATRVLCLSDPIVPGMPDSNLRTIYRLVNRRWELARPTWATMNSIARKDMVAALGGQTVSRLLDGAVVEFCNWPDFRQRRRD